MEQLPLVPRCDNARGQAGEVNGKAMFSASDLTPPVTTGQCAQVLNLIRQHQLAQWLINALGLQGA